MKTLANIIWILFGGIWLALGWAVAGAILYITVIGIPFGKQCFKFAALSLAPFGKSVDIRFFKHPLANTLWAIFFGWEMALGYLGAGILSCITVVGIPFGLQSFKFMKLALLPFGAKIR